MSDRPRVHLVSYATPRFFHRQAILGISARMNHIADTVTAWNPRRLKAAGFGKRVPDIGLEERGSGFWSWKPFIIQKRLQEVPDGDIVFYCDVGRRYPFTILDQPIDPFIAWMDSMKQEVMPGVENTWDGPVGKWTKRDALVFMGMDRREVYESTMIQGGFSFWRAGVKSREFVGKWMELCAMRSLVSDDPSKCGIAELPGFRENRHDQSLLTLLCLKEGVSGLKFIEEKPLFQSGDPAKVAKYTFGIRSRSIPGLLVDLFLARPVQFLEKMIRSRWSFSRENRPPESTG